MKLLRCPLNGPRNISEFVCGELVEERPDPATCTDEAWTDHLFMESNHAGIVTEWWLHVPSSYWFIVERDTVSEAIIATHTAADFFHLREKPEP